MKGRKFAAVLIVLSMILMLMPVQAFAGEEAEETASERVTAVSEIPEGDGTGTELEAVQEEPETSAAENTAVAEGSEELTEEKEEEEEEVSAAVLETAEESAVNAVAAAAGEMENEAAEMPASEETEAEDAAMAEESDLTQIIPSASSEGVTWSDVTAAAGSDGVQTVTFSATIAEGTTADELNLNVLDSGSMSVITSVNAAGQSVRYLVNVTDNTGSYAFKADSGALILAGSNGAAPETVSLTSAQKVLIGTDVSGSFSSADTYLTANGEGNGFNSILQNQWQSGQTAQTLQYYQQAPASDSELYPTVQFKLTRTETAAAEETTAQEELSGTVPISARKVLTGQTLKAEQFSFELKDENGNVLQTKKNAQDGSIPFDALQFTGDDLGEHKYTINEVMPEGAKADSNGKIVVDNIEYDTHTETVTITISLNDEGKLKATVRQSTTELTFTNKYTGTGSTTTTSRKSPATGDGTPVMLYFSMLAGAGLALVLIKRMRHVPVKY